MKDAPDINNTAFARTLRDAYGIEATDIRHLPLGHDANASVFRVESRNDGALFAKIRTGLASDTGLAVARALVDSGIPNILAPIPTRSGAVTTPLLTHPNRTLALFPFIDGDSAMELGLASQQWRRFGATLRAIHDCELPPDTRVPASTFNLPAAGLVRCVSQLANGASLPDRVALDFAAFWRKNQPGIDEMLDRAITLGQSFGERHFRSVPCHADIHAANILVGDDDAIWLIDWDAPLLASPERDLFFVIGSRIARAVTHDEEIAFFDGYGPIDIDAEALIYYRYERIIEDIGEFGIRILGNPEISAESRAYEAQLARSLFEPGADIDCAEIVAPASPLVGFR